MNPRALAIGVLSRVRATDGYLNVVLDAQLRQEASLSSRDAGLVTELCYGVCRRQMTLDFALAPFSGRKLESLEDRVLCALRVGAYQMFYTRIPRRAAVAETVEALKQLGVQRAAGFTNAVLRKLALVETMPLPPEDDRVKHLSIRESHPQWLTARWLTEFGGERVEAMMAADNQPARVVVRANTSLCAPEALLAQLAEAGLKVEPTSTSSAGIVLLEPGRLEGLLGYAEGWWQVQDEAAQCVGLYASIPQGARVWDACAAPGGKACHLAERCEVLATDVQSHKLRKIEAEAQRLRLAHRIQTAVHDATGPLPEGGSLFDAVLLDAPCSGLGTLRRHPELRYRRSEADVSRLAVLQGQLLERCAQAVSPRGLLIYAVCSTEPEEGISQIRAFLERHPEFTLEPPELALPLDHGFLRTWPGPKGWDGFFAARLRKAAG